MQTLPFKYIMICENEYQFVLICKLYDNERGHLLEHIMQMFPHIVNYSQGVLYRWLSNMDENIYMYVFLH